MQAFVKKLNYSLNNYVATNEKLIFSTHEEELLFLEKNGFNTSPGWTKVNNLKEAWVNSQKIKDSRDQYEFGIDGAVIKINDNSIVEKAGIVGKAPRGLAAVKFPAEEVVTKLISIDWQVGRTGKLTPVANLESRIIAQTNVSRATFHNYKEVFESDLHIGDSLIVRKAGDIIPEVVQVLENLREDNAKAITAPTTCPSCSTELLKSETGVDLYCPNTDNCRTQIILRLSYYAQRSIANINGLSEKIIEKLVDELGVKDVQDLYKLDYDKIFIMEGFGKKSVDNLKESIKQSRTIEAHKFLAGFGVEGIGPEVAKLILSKLK